MKNVLLKKLRTCSDIERKGVALELAKIGKEHIIKELIRMAEGKRRIWLRWYNVSDQLAAIKALGESRRLKALLYLRSLIENTVSIKTYRSVMQTYDFGYSTEYTEVHFPKAKKGLGEILKYTIVSARGDYGNIEPLLESEVEYSHKKARASNEAFGIISTSISRLEISLK